MLGKWHLGSAPGFLPHEAGFDSWLGLPYSHEEGYPGPFPEGLIWPPVPLMANGTILEQPFDSNTLTDRYTAGAVAAIDAAELRSNPLFLHVAYEAPHVPLFAGPAFRAASGHQTPSRENSASRERRRRRSPFRFRGTSRRGLFGDAVEEMDASVGRVAARLRDATTRGTLLLFASDNGAWVHPSRGIGSATSATIDPWDGGSQPFRDEKGTTWEGGVRVPALVGGAARESIARSHLADLWTPPRRRGRDAAISATFAYPRRRGGRASSRPRRSA